MKYIVCKQFKKKGLSGEFNLKKGSSCEEIDGFITHNGQLICAKTSQNAFDYFARNDDKQGYNRFNLVQEILDLIKEYVIEYNDAYTAGEENINDKVSKSYNAIREAYPTFLRKSLDVLSFDFYNAEVLDLEMVLQLVQGAGE